MERLPRAGLLAALLAAVVLYCPALGTLPVLEAKWAAAVLALGALAAWALATGSPVLRPPNGPARWAWALAGAFALSAAASGCGEAAAFRTAQVAVLAVALGWASRAGEAGARTLMRTLSLLGGLTGLLMSLQRFSEQAGAATFDHKGLAASFLSITLPVSLDLSMRETGRWKGFSLLSLGTLSCGLILGETRAAWIAAAAGSLPLLLFRNRPLRGVAWALAGALLAAVVVAGAVDARLPNRIASIWRNREPRVVFWQASLSAWSERPWLGHGPGSFPRAVAPAAAHLLTGTRVESYSTYAHDDPLQTGVEAGLLGLAALLALAAASAFTALRGLKAGAPFSAASAGALLAGSVNALLCFPLHDPGCALALAALAGIAAGGAGTEPEGKPRTALAALAVLAMLLSLRLPAGLKRLPMPGEVRREAGRAALFRGETVRGRRYLERAVTEAPWDPEARMGLAHARFLAGDPPGAYAVLARSIADFPYASRPAFELAWGDLLQKEGRDLQAALDHLSYPAGNEASTPRERTQALSLMAACRRRMGDARMTP